MFKLPSGLAIASLCLILTACSGGGGGGNNEASQDSSDTSTPVKDDGIVSEPPDKRPLPPTNPTPVDPPDIPDNTPDPTVPTEPAVSELMISEFNYAHAGHSGMSVVPWFEVYNPNDTAVLLSDYVLRSNWRLVPRPGHIEDYQYPFSSEPMEFALPSVAVPAKGYLVIASKSIPYGRNTSQIAYVNKDHYFPDWTTGGSIELVKAGQTADFVKLGTTQAMPGTTGAWAGQAISLPSGVNQFGNSFVRLDVNTHGKAASAWGHARFATPGGRNDVATNATDVDEDGIPDSAEIPGGTYAGMDLHAMGARAGRKDIFIEFDYTVYEYEGQTYSLQPQEEAMKMVAEAFAKRNIAIHFDTGSAYSGSFNPARYNLGGGNAIPRGSCLPLRKVTPEGCQALYDYKAQHMDIRRRFIFHYGVFAPYVWNANAEAEYYGNDMAFSTRAWTNGTGMQESDFNSYVNLQASTIMHELGHNLGLHHGGHEDRNYKPNHVSVMNYVYWQLGVNFNQAGMSASARQRCYIGTAPRNICQLENDASTRSFVIDFSDGTSADIDENNLSEALNIGRGSLAGAYADWDNDGKLTPGTYARNILPFNSYEPAPPRLVLKDYDEWTNIALLNSSRFRIKEYSNVGIEH